MLIKSVNGKSPIIPNDCYVAENATIVGDVILVILAVFGLTQLSEEMSILLKLVIRLISRWGCNTLHL
jgi:hypothetical protein